MKIIFEAIFGTKCYASNTPLTDRTPHAACPSKCFRIINLEMTQLSTTQVLYFTMISNDCARYAWKMYERKANWMSRGVKYVLQVSSTSVTSMLRLLRTSSSKTSFLILMKRRFEINRHEVSRYYATCIDASILARHEQKQNLVDAGSYNLSDHCLHQTTL